MFSIITKLKQWLLGQSGFLGSETTVSESNSQKEYDVFPTPGRNRNSNLPDYLQDEPCMDKDEVLDMFRPYVEKIIVSQNAVVDRSPRPESEEASLLKNENDWENNTKSCNL